MYVTASGSTSNQPRCPAGTYSNMTGLSLSTECTDCTASQYCEDMGLTQPNGPCDPGNKHPSFYSNSDQFWTLKHFGFVL